MCGSSGFIRGLWWGRVRSSNGVAASLPADAVVEFDADLARLLRERVANVPHRIRRLVARF